MMKACTKCFVYKSLDDFYRSARARDGRASWCKSCVCADTAERTRLRRLTPEGKQQYTDWARVYQRRRKLLGHGVPEERVEALVEEAEGGRCHACGRPASMDTIPNQSARRLHVDHDHRTNAYRGLLCQKCNSVLGLVDDSVERLECLIEYLHRHEATRVAQDIDLSR